MGDNTPYENWENVFEKLLWIAKLLEQDFDYAILSSALKDKAYTINGPSGNMEYIWFNDEHLQQNGYEISREWLYDGVIIRLTKSIV